MPARGSALDLSDDELEANAEIIPDRDLPAARDWMTTHVPGPFQSFWTAREDPNDPATPDSEPTT